jgi:ABC-2 type transport system ATP-binding protein
MITIRGLSKTFKGRQVLNSVDLEIPRGSIHALLGANGSGKSTLIYLLSGLLKADEGTCCIDGEVITPNRYQYRNKVGYVFEKPLYIEKFSAREYLQFVADLYGLPKKVYQSRVEELLAFMNLPTDNRRYIESYSKGMKNKVSLAAALIHHPQYLILDEPFDGIDFASVQKISKLLRNLAAKGVTILLTSHQYDILAAVSDHFALLKEGSVLFYLPLPALETLAARDFPGEKNPVKAYLESLMDDNQDKNELSWNI